MAARLGARRFAAPAVSDPVTGAYPRPVLAASLTGLVAEAESAAGACSILLFDVDFFKSVNDAYGHARGDAVLRQLAGRVTHLVRPGDTLVRYGGDEFVLLLPDTAPALALAVARRVATGVQAWPFSGSPELTVSVSIGVASFPADAADPAGLLAVADRRNYLAKRRGRGCAVADDDSGDARPICSPLERPPAAGDASGTAAPCLPTALSEFVGREPEIAELTGLLDAGRLVTLIGPGGVGKTRLALAVTAQRCDRHADGAAYVALAEATTEQHVATALAETFSLTEAPGQSLTAAVGEHLRDRDLLLVLDNFEQVLGAASVIADLLAVAPGLTVLVTSRERLRLDGEHAFHVPPLDLPDLDRLPTDDDGVSHALAASSALALFARRAESASYGFMLTPDNLGAAALLCHRLDGLPLALELAAARTGEFTPAALLTQLGGRLDLLDEGPRDQPERQQTLRATIDWSFQLLEPSAQDLLIRLGAFTGGCTPVAVAAVTGFDGQSLLSVLLEKNLLRCVPGALGQPRYELLETIRSYAAERLAGASDAARVHAAHAAYFAALSEQAGVELVRKDAGDWITMLTQEHPNVRTALGWSLETGDVATAATIMTGLLRFWLSGPVIGEGRAWCDRVLAADPLPAVPRADLLLAAGLLACWQTDLDVSEALTEEGLRLARTAGHDQGVGNGLNGLGLVAALRNDLPTAERLYRESLAVQRARGDDQRIASALGNLSGLLGDTDPAEAEAMVLEAQQLFQKTGDQIGILSINVTLSELMMRRGHTDGVRPMLEESLRLSRELTDTNSESSVLHQIGELEVMEGDRAAALEWAHAALALKHELRDVQGMAVTGEFVAEIVAPMHPALALQLLASSERLREQHGVPATSREEARRAACVAELRMTVSAESFTAHWDAGYAAEPADVLTAALAIHAA